MRMEMVLSAMVGSEVCGCEVFLGERDGLGSGDGEEPLAVEEGDLDGGELPQDMREGPPVDARGPLCQCGYPAVAGEAFFGVPSSGRASMA